MDRGKPRPRSCGYMAAESAALEERVTEIRLRKRWREIGMESYWNPLKACEQALCNDYLKTASHTTAARRSDGSFNEVQAKYFLSTKKAINYLTVMRETMSAGVESTYKWKLAKLKTSVESVIGDDKDDVDKKHLSSAISAIGVMNKMEGHEAPTSAVVMNIDQDNYLKRITEVANSIMEEQKNELEFKGDE